MGAQITTAIWCPAHPCFPTRLLGEAGEFMKLNKVNIIFYK